MQSDVHHSPSNCGKIREFEFVSEAVNYISNEPRHDTGLLKDRDLELAIPQIVGQIVVDKSNIGSIG